MLRPPFVCVELGIAPISDATVFTTLSFPGLAGQRRGTLVMAQLESILGSMALGSR
jgi:hypothetical protein